MANEKPSYEELLARVERAEAAQRTSEHLLNSFLQQSHTGGWEFDPVTRVADRTLEQARIFGYADLSQEWTLDTVLGHVIPEEREAAETQIREGMAAGKDWSFDCRIRRIDGEVRWIWAAGGRRNDVNGQAGRYCGIVQDITDRKTTEHRLTQMKRLYATLSQVNQTIVRVKSPEELYQSICDVSVQFGEVALAWIGLLDEAATGLVFAASASRCGGNSLDGFLGDLTRNRLTAAAVAANGVAMCDDIRSDPRTEAMRDMFTSCGCRSVAAVPFRRGGKVVGVLNLIAAEAGFFTSDEEARLLEEMALDISFALDMMESERVRRQWADAFENCAHGIAIGDPFTNRIITCNPAFARQRGTGIDDVVSMPIAELYAPEHRELLRRNAEESDRVGHARFEALRLRRDGTAFPVQMDLVSVRDHDGKLLYRVATQQDITERKRAEAERLSLAATLEAALASITDAVFISDAEGRFVHFNEAFATFHKFESKEECAKTLAEYPAFLDVYTTSGELVPIEGWAVPRALRGEIATNAEFTLWRRDSGESWIGSYSFAPIRDAAGTIVGSVVIGRDITEHKRAEIELQFHQDLLDDAARLARLGGWRFDVATGRGYLTDEVARIHDLEPSAPMSREIGLQFYTEESKPLIEAAVRDVVERGVPYDLELEIVSAKGVRKWVRTIGRPVMENGQVVWAQGSMQDITERVRADEALRESEDRFRTLIEAAPEGVFVQCEGRFEFMNPAMAQILGAESPEQLIGTSLWDRTAPEFHELVRSRIRHQLDTGLAAPPLEQELLRIDGERITVENDRGADPVPWEPCAPRIRARLHGASSGRRPTGCAASAVVAGAEARVDRQARGRRGPRFQQHAERHSRVRRGAAREAASEGPATRGH